VSGHRRRRDRTRRLVWAGWGLLVALLAANLATALAGSRPDVQTGFLTPEILQAAGFWVPLLVAVAMSVAGWFWAGRAYALHPRSSLLWARRGYVFTLAAAAALAIACLDAELFPRAWFAVVAATAVGGQALFFGILSFREYRRAEAGHGRHRSGEGSDRSAAGDAAR
jgi:hypothetical protein